MHRPFAAVPSETQQPESPRRNEGRDTIYPLAFSSGCAQNIYMDDSAVRLLVEFFEKKGLDALKREDRLEEWYDDWVAYQRHHGLYAAVLSPGKYSSLGNSFDLLRYSRFLEVFAYCSPAHGYSLQVTFLGLFSILMGTNEALKQEAVAAVETGNLLAFGVSEKDHGSDLLGNEFTIAETDADSFMANGTKYYIGNTDAASMISILGRKVTHRAVAAGSSGHANRAPFVLIALRPKLAAAFRSLGKIRTLGVRAANVGSFELKKHLVPESDVIAEGRKAWDAIFGTITLGKFFLGFGSIGICEHAFQEAVTHLRKRRLYGKAVIEMRHIHANILRAWLRLTAMKLYAYRALDYVCAASGSDRRYLLFCAVQKARVSTEGLRVMALLQECMGAKGFEGSGYFEMALRDVQLIPNLEGSMHINLGLALQFIPRYFGKPDSVLDQPPSLTGGEAPSRENAYLMEARWGSTHAVGFRSFLDAYCPIASVASVSTFGRQIETFREIANLTLEKDAKTSDMQVEMALGQCFATIVYGQLIAENAVRLDLPEAITSSIFSILVEDLSVLALQLAALPGTSIAIRGLITKIIEVPETNAAEWDVVSRQFEQYGIDTAGGAEAPVNA
jgi:acyl-CoA dehydrogenase